MRCRPSGPVNAPIACVGEAPGANEEREGIPFIGAAGWELEKVAKEAGLMKDAFYLTNITHERPPSNDIEEWIITQKAKPPGDFVPFRGKWVRPFIVEECQRLYQELRNVSPNVTIALGNYPLWALCPDDKPISKWRGSILTSDAVPGLKVIPAYHPSFLLRSYSDRWITISDFERARRESYSPLLKSPAYSFGIKPSYRDAEGWLKGLISQLDAGPTPFTCDLEIIRREILCVGIGLSETQAFCLPFLWSKGFYWTPEEALTLQFLLRQALLHPNAQVINQNLSFDIQYLFWRLFIRPKAYFDTMIAQNLLFSGLPKDLAYIASQWCDHYVYWKDDGKFWRDGIESDDQLWRYNCLDCTYTYEAAMAMLVSIDEQGLAPQMTFQMKTFENLMGMMLRGVRVDMDAKAEVHKELDDLIDTLHLEVKHLAQRSLVGPKGDFSSKKLATLFYEELRLPLIFKDKKVTCDDEAMKKIAKNAPYLRPLTDRINMIRSYGTAVDVCRKRVDADGRWRTSYNVAGTTTYRLASSENPLDSGCNLQNLTLGRDILQ